MSWHYLQEGEGASWHQSCSDGIPFALSKLMPEQGKSFSTVKEMELLDNSQYGMTLRHLMGNRGEDSQTLSQEDSLVRTSANAEKGPDLTEPDQDYGWKWPGSFAKFNQNSLSWKTRQCSLLGDLDEFSGIWPEWGLMQDGECLELPELEQPITERGFCWLLTPTAQSWKSWTFRNPRALIRKNHADGNLQEQLMRLYQKMTTPRCQEILMCWPEGWTDSKPLEMDGFRQWLREQSQHLQHGSENEQNSAKQ